MILRSSDFDPISQTVRLCFPRGYALLQEVLVVLRVLSQASALSESFSSSSKYPLYQRRLIYLCVPPTSLSFIPDVRHAILGYATGYQCQ